MEKFYLICAYVLSGIFGLCVGSFLNVVIYRLPNKMSLAKPNSHCPTCKYELRWYDNIPVLSYVMLGGKCRSCKTHISFRYTAVELANTVLWLLCAFIFWERSIPLACIYMVAFSVFLCVFFIDLEHQIIFDRFQIILLVLGVASIFFDKDYGWLSHVIGGVSGFAVFYLISWGFEKLCGKEGLGGGDVKLAGVVGLLLGWERLLLGLLIATIPAAVIMLILSKGKKGESRQFPFAPFLVVGFGASMLFGTQIISWYLSLLGL
ncbi:MAG: prepilin peptidase [Ruminococcaceae bacterium]|nr:prepilin peptidase [Oscillospiraceae bacterium]